MSTAGGEDGQGMPLSASMLNLTDATTDEPRTVLRVIVENVVYAVSLDTLKQVRGSPASSHWDFIFLKYYHLFCIADDGHDDPLAKMTPSDCQISFDYTYFKF